MALFSVTEGDMVEVVADIKNTGDSVGSKNVTLDVDGVTEDTENNFELDPGEVNTLNFYWQTSDGDAGTDIPVKVVTPDDSDSIKVTVNSP